MQSICITCGRQHQTRTGDTACAGHHKHTGDPCTAFPVNGTDKCRMHLGKKSAPAVIEAKVRKAMATYGTPVEINPADALLAEVHRTAGHVKWLADCIAELDPEVLTWGTTQIKTGGHDGGTTEAAAPHVMLQLYQEERKHLVRVCAEAIRCGIEERRVRIAEQQGQMVADLIRNVLAALGLSPEQRAVAVEIVPRLLRELTAA